MLDSSHEPQRQAIPWLQLHPLVHRIEKLWRLRSRFSALNVYRIFNFQWIKTSSHHNSRSINKHVKIGTSKITVMEKRFLGEQSQVQCLQEKKFCVPRKKAWERPCSRSKSGTTLILNFPASRTIRNSNSLVIINHQVLVFCYRNSLIPSLFL